MIRKRLRIRIKVLSLHQKDINPKIPVIIKYEAKKNIIEGFGRPTGS